MSPGGEHAGPTVARPELTSAECGRVRSAQQGRGSTMSRHYADVRGAAVFTSTTLKAGGYLLPPPEHLISEARGMNEHWTQRHCHNPDWLH